MRFHEGLGCEKRISLLFYCCKTNFKLLILFILIMILIPCKVLFDLCMRTVWSSLQFDQCSLGPREDITSSQISRWHFQISNLVWLVGQSQDFYIWLHNTKEPYLRRGLFPVWAAGLSFLLRYLLSQSYLSSHLKMSLDIKCLFFCRPHPNLFTVGTFAARVIHPRLNEKIFRHNALHSKDRWRWPLLSFILYMAA